MITKQDFIGKIRQQFTQSDGVEDNQLFDSIIAKYPEYKDKVLDTFDLGPSQPLTMGTGVTGRGQVIAPVTEEVDILPREVSLPGKIIEGAEFRAGEFVETAEAQREGDIGFVSGAIRNIGDITGFVASDVIGSIVGSAAETLFQVAGEPGKEDFKAFLESEDGKEIVNAIDSGMQDYRRLKLEHPNKAEIFESFINIADFATLGLAAKPVRELGEKAVEVAEGAVKDWSVVAKEAIEPIIPKPEPKLGLKKEIEPKGFRQKQSEGIIVDNNPMLPRDKQNFKQISGKDYQEWLYERGFRGTAGDNVDGLARKFVKEKDAIDNAFEQIPGRYKPAGFKEILEDSILFAQATNAPDLVKLQGIARGLEQTSGALAKDIIDVKRFFERNNKFTYNSIGADPTKARLATNLDTALREGLIDIAERVGLREYRAASKELQQTKEALDGLARKQDRQTTGNLFDISDKILGPVGFVEPSILLGIGVKKIFTSEVVRAVAAKALGGKTVTTPALQLSRLREGIRKFEAEQKTKRKEAKVERKKEKKEIEEAVKEGVLADELQKRGFVIGDGFIMKQSDELMETPITKEEIKAIRSTKNKDEAKRMSNYIIQLRAEGKELGEGFIAKEPQRLKEVRTQLFEELEAVTPAQIAKMEKGQLQETITSLQEAIPENVLADGTKLHSLLKRFDQNTFEIQIGKNDTPAVKALKSSVERFLTESFTFDDLMEILDRIQMAKDKLK